MKTAEKDAMRREVRRDYARAARGRGGCCGPRRGGACGARPRGTSRRLGYSDAELAAAPAESDLGLGCGNPQAIASLRKGDTVLDLGSGAGLDCFLAARAVGRSGAVIGVDMTPEMVERARANARKGGWKNVEFRLGEIERLPAADASVDVILSNCVINLSPDKRAVFREAARVLKPGGRLAVSDIVTARELTPAERERLGRRSGCRSGAESAAELERMLRAAGFENVRIRIKDESRAFIRDWSKSRAAAELVVSATIEAVKRA